MKICSRCKITREKSFFYADKRNKDGLQSNCSTCCREHSMLHRANNLEQAKATCLRTAKLYYQHHKEKVKSRVAKWVKNNKAKRSCTSKKNKLKRTNRVPVWANSKKIEAFYTFRDYLSHLTLGLILYEVDHIVPLNGKYVSGLHVENNLQILRADQNRAKGNKYEAH